MDKHLSEQALRCEAIRRRLAGETRKQICHDLGRSTSWFDKWWAAYRCDPHIDFADHSRTPHTSPNQTPAALVQTILSVRQTLEAATTAETKYGLIGPRAIQAALAQLQIVPPSVAAIQRILQAHGLTHPLGAGHTAAYYPWPQAWCVNAIQATDIITRHVRGGEEIQNFHTLDLYSHAVAMTQHPDKKSVTTMKHLLATWSKLGLPQIQQLDNEGSFCGGHTHLRVLGRVVRLCLFCGIEPLFPPFYDPKRNHQIETFHSLWHQAFWSRQTFRNCEHVQTELPFFAAWYHHHYHPPVLHGKTPAQMRRGVVVVGLTRGMCRLIPLARLPITAGRIHFMRKVDSTGRIELLNEPWTIGRNWSGEYVRATINTAEQSITFWHKASDTSPWHLLKRRQFRFKEPVVPVLPEFQRNRTRCCEYLPG